MDNLCRSCKESISEHARVCTYCGSPQTLFGHFAAALKWIGGIATVVSLVLAVNSLINISQIQFEKREALHEIADAADQLRDDGDYARAWLLYSDAEKLDPGSRRVRRGQEVLVEEWLPNVEITGEETYTDIVNKVLPVLMRALVRSEGAKKADFQALVGWAHYLEQQERKIHDTDVPGLYRRALALDPGNAYANTFLGHWYYSQAENMVQGRAHFERALKSGKHRLFVRGYQWSGLSNLKYQTRTGDEDHIAVRGEQLKMIHQMMANDEPWVTGHRDSMQSETIEAYGQPYSVRYDWFEKVWPVLQPEQHLKLVTTMSTEFADDSFVWPLAQFLLGRIQEKMNNHDQALVHYQQLDARLAVNDKLRPPLNTAMQRLTGQLPAIALLLSDPLAFHSNSLITKAFNNPDYALAIGYFDELVSKAYSQQALDKVDPAIATLKTASERVAQWLEQHNGSQHDKDKLIDAYWNLSSAVGTLLLYQGAVDESVTYFKKLTEDSRLDRLMQMYAFYNLASSLSERSQIVSGQQQDRLKDREQAVANLLKSIEYGYSYSDWQYTKGDSCLDAIREHPDYIRVMTGR